MTVQTKRQAAYAIDEAYINRWSPRAFSTKEVEEEKLNAIFEAARWAPSAANWQPWNYIVARKEEDRATFLSFINENNVEWCKRAPVLVLAISKKTRNEEGDPNPWHAFDAGTAWGYLSLEAYRQGLITHGMGGFDKDKARELLEIPAEYDINAVVAVGYHDPTTLLSERNQQREVPSDRKPIESFVFEGKFA